MTKFEAQEKISSAERKITAASSSMLAEVFPSELTPNGVGSTLRSMRAYAEIHAIKLALDKTNWNRKRAAQILEISYRGLLWKIQQYHITRPGSMPSAPAGKAVDLAAAISREESLR